MKDLTLLLGRIFLVAIFPISAYYKIIGWPGITRPLTRPACPIRNISAWSALPPRCCFRSSSSSACSRAGPRSASSSTSSLPPISAIPVIWRVAPDAFFRELMGVMKNLAMIGGLLLLMGAGPGRFALQPSRDEYEA